MKTFFDVIKHGNDLAGGIAICVLFATVRLAGANYVLGITK